MMSAENCAGRGKDARQAEEEFTKKSEAINTVSGIMTGRVSKDKVRAKRVTKPKEVAAEQPVRRVGTVKKVTKAAPAHKPEKLDVNFTGLLDEADLFAEKAVAVTTSEADAAIAFDGLWYLSVYPDVREAGIEPVEHFLKHGMDEGRNPNPHFDGAAYIKANPDIEAFPFGPFMHYVCFGFREKRPLR